VSISFGEYEGWTVGEVEKENPDYLERLSENCWDREELKEALDLLIDASPEEGRTTEPQAGTARRYRVVEEGQSWYPKEAYKRGIHFPRRRGKRS